MTGVTTSLRARWADYAAFLRRPRLPDAPLARPLDALRTTAAMLALDAILMAGLMALVIAAMALGFDIARSSLADLKITFQIAAALVVLAPFMEEIVFRSWLSGRPGHVLALLILLASAAFGAALSLGLVPGARGLSAPVAMALGAVLAGLALFIFRGRGPMGWFRAIFPGLFWLSTLLFASAHLLNFPEENLAMALPLVLPQFVLATILGYLRVHCGLWSAMLLHMSHNGLIVGMIALALAFQR